MTDTDGIDHHFLREAMAREHHEWIQELERQRKLDSYKDGLNLAGEAAYEGCVRFYFEEGTKPATSCEYEEIVSK